MTIRGRLLRDIPPQEVADSLAHDQLLVGFGEPGEFFGEQGHAFFPRAGHAGNVGAPEHAVGAE